MVDFIIDIIIMACIGVMVVGVVAVAGDIPKLTLAEKVEPEYEEYETAARIAEIWNDGNAVGLCEFCGMDDAPIFKLWDGKHKCKWCAELNNLNYHLEHHGVRRLRKK